jgi:hypothetical protein
MHTSGEVQFSIITRTIHISGRQGQGAALLAVRMLELKPLMTFRGAHMPKEEEEEEEEEEAGGLEVVGAVQVSRHLSWEVHRHRRHNMAFTCSLRQVAGRTLLNTARLGMPVVSSAQPRGRPPQLLGCWRQVQRVWRLER